VVSECPIEVEVLNGRVTLLGSMSNWILRDDIEAAVKQLPDVISVINLISIKKPATDKAIKTARRHLSETEVTVWIMIAILFALTILTACLFSAKLAR
jgi:osmotically-inducible protein OsmY